jgi:quinol-cytochrome oxidoreductase complex cytochrome b subunit
LTRIKAPEVSGAFVFLYKCKNMVDRKKIKLAPVKVYYRRLWKNVLFGTTIMFFCLLLGVLGYKFTIPEMD